MKQLPVKSAVLIVMMVPADAEADLLINPVSPLLPRVMHYLLSS
jgi:hypothetical protein